MHMLRTHLRGRLLWKCKVCTLSRIYACAFASNCSTFRIFIIALRNFFPWSQLNNDLSMMSFTAWALCTSEIRTFSAYNRKSRTVLNKTVVPNYLLVNFLLLPINSNAVAWGGAGGARAPPIKISRRSIPPDSLKLRDFGARGGPPQ